MLRLLVEFLDGFGIEALIINVKRRMSGSLQARPTATGSRTWKGRDGMPTSSSLGLGGNHSTPSVAVQLIRGFKIAPTNL